MARRSADTANGPGNGILCHSEGQEQEHQRQHCQRHAPIAVGFSHGFASQTIIVGELETPTQQVRLSL